MEISKSAVLLANEHQNDSVIGKPENVASWRILTKLAASVFHRILSNIKYFRSYKSSIYGFLPHEEAG